MNRRFGWLGCLAAIGALTVGVVPVGAQAARSGPRISLSKAEVEPNETILVTIDGFDGHAVVLTVCGNAARRRSQDCNLVESENQHLSRDGSPTVAALPVGRPPLPCPCVIMASTPGFRQMTFTPIVIKGHPTAPIVGKRSFDSLGIDVEAKRRPEGLVRSLRSLLGGPTAYDVTVTIQNRSGESLTGVGVEGVATRGGHDAGAIDFDKVGDLGPGERWVGHATSTVSAPIFRDVGFDVTAVGLGEPATASTSIDYLPWLLVVLVVVLIADLTAIAVRRMRRRRNEPPEVSPSVGEGSPAVQPTAMAHS